MQRTLIRDIGAHIGTRLTIAGFAQVIRNQGSITFILVRDVSGVVQVVVTKDVPEAMDAAKAISLESVIEVRGLVKQEGQAPGGIEIAAAEINVLSAAEPELPIPIFEKGSQEEAEQSIRMDWRWLDLRKPSHLLIFKVWTAMEAGFREYWVKHGYIEIHSPKLIGAPSESGAEVFEVNYFGRKAYLAQSPQFYKQMAMAAGFEKVFEVGPVFRAEPSMTSRHATEFTGYDMEISYIKSHEEVMAEEEKAIAHALHHVHTQYGDEIKKEFGRELVVPVAPFPRVTFAEAKKILREMSVPSEKENDFSPEEERKLGEYINEKHRHEFVFVTAYPHASRAFYHMRDEQDPHLTKGFDLFWNGLEVTTGAQREHRYDVLIAQAKERKMNIERIEFYLNFFKYGCPPHGGFGMGPNRMMMKLLGLESIREAMFLYRGVKRLEP